ncbi:hypothetical protein CCH79_00013996 [Gambusia affinis]|uniref:RING-type domain-containing protein n=1 Tax=Gambusia affinis TaxID=33528 RepID=A0A315W1A8_GAMAF|nr:hypothetical protein CCH79_00013996 [Gambusia affinis]
MAAEWEAPCDTPEWAAGGWQEEEDGDIHKGAFRNCRLAIGASSSSSSSRANVTQTYRQTDGRSDGRSGAVCDEEVASPQGVFEIEQGLRPLLNYTDLTAVAVQTIISMSSDFPHYGFKMPNIGFQNLPLNIYIVVFGTAIFVFILSLLFCCYLISEKQQFPLKLSPRHLAISCLAGQRIPLTLLREVKVIQKEKVKELNLHETFMARLSGLFVALRHKTEISAERTKICAVCLEEFKQKDELGICPCKHAFHRKCLIKWLEVRKVCPLCNMPVLQLAQQAGTTEPPVPVQQPLPGAENLV